MGERAVKELHEMTYDEITRHLEEGFGLAAPGGDDREEFFQWVAAGFSIMCCRHAAERGGTAEDGLRAAQQFFERFDDSLSKGVLPYITGAAVAAP